MARVEVGLSQFLFAAFAPLRRKCDIETNGLAQC
jgi:hypothetical protein